MNDLIVGGMAGVISRTATAPIELYKIQLQSNYLKDATMMNVIRKEGLRYMWKGNLANCVRAFPQFAINYGVYKKCQKIYYHIKNDKIRNFLCGGIAGITAMTAVYPLETIRTRLALQMNQSHYKTPWQVIKKLNINQLYGGLKISLLGFGPFNALNFMFYNWYKDILNENIEKGNYNIRLRDNNIQLSNYINSSTVNLLAGGLSGMSSLTITYPTDLLRRRFQMEGFNNETPKYNGIIDGFKTIVKEEGIIGLYRGLSLGYLRVFPCLGIQFWCLEKGKAFLE